MKFNLEKIVNIKTKKDLDVYNPEEPIFYDNYLFHYLIILDKFDLLKMQEHPIYKLNEDGLDGFMLAAKYDNMPILKYLIKKYPDYAQNHNNEGLHFINYLANPLKLISIMKEFTNIDWYYLFKFKNDKSIEFFCYFISILDNSDLLWFLKEESTKKLPIYYVLKSIIINNKLTDTEKKKIFDKYSEKEINLKDYENIGLIITLINMEDIKLTEYFIKRKLDLEYILKPVTDFITPFSYLYSKLCFQSNKNLEKILELLWDNVKLDFNFINKLGFSYVTICLFSCKNESPIFEKITDWILKNSPDSAWNKVSYLKENSLFYIINKPFDTYKKYIKDRVLDTDLTNRQGKSIFDLIVDAKWANLLKKSKKFVPDLNIDLEINKYQHYTKFTATMMDILIYFIYLDKKYKNLYIPKIYEVTQNRNDFPFVINYIEHEGVLDINLKLNSLINSVRREKSHDFALLFLSLTLEGELKHANIILYDFNNLTIERFEPYGDDCINNVLDDYLEEELTWNTGFKYLRPCDFLTKPSYQSLSYEGNESLKSGDFGGFCLGWCIWYAEHRMKNSKIDSKVLNQKTLEKLLRSDDTLTEFIRNFSNKLFDSKLNIVKKICPNGECIPEKNISNLYISKEDESKIINFAEEYFEFKKKSIK